MIEFEWPMNIWNLENGLVNEYAILCCDKNTKAIQNKDYDWIQ